MIYNFNIYKKAERVGQFFFYESILAFSDQAPEAPYNASNIRAKPVEGLGII